MDTTDTTASLPSSRAIASAALSLFPVESLMWHYEHGLLVHAIERVGRVHGDDNLSSIGLAYLERFISPDGEIATYRKDEFNLDQINPGKLLFPAFDETGDERYKRAIEILRYQLEHQPRTPSGGYWHKMIYPDQMWLDGLYMAEPFNARLHAETNGDFSDVVRQFVLMEEKARDSRTGLLYHAWDERRRQLWADPVTGCSPHFWGRANGWFAMALVDVLEIIPGGDPGVPVLTAILNRILSAMLSVRDPESALWYQVLDQSARKGNYREASVSAMMVYSMGKAARRGWVDALYTRAAAETLNGIITLLLELPGKGRELKLSQCCAVAGLGGNPYRDGTYEYYTGETVAVNDFKALGPLILGCLEVEAAQNPAIAKALRDCEWAGDKK